MEVKSFTDILGLEFYTGVPDSRLKALCDYLLLTYGEDHSRHIIAANEGNAVGIAAGYYLATGKPAVVYLQNSGEGNILNPVTSLCNDKVYGIPMLFVIGWRGEPGEHDEPQHVFQGEITLKLLETLNITYFIISKDTTETELSEKMAEFRSVFAQGKQAAFIVRTGALTFDQQPIYSNVNLMRREEIIRHILDFSGTDLIVSTTGKASRELFELREARGEGHERDFLTVGSMGHSSSIALGIALQRPEKCVWIIDGDGSMLMHMGALAVIGSINPKNVIHIIINNGAHESVGGQPTVAQSVDIPAIARACGYPHSVRAEEFLALDNALSAAKAANELSLIEAKCAIGARKDLGRPTTTARENRELFMEYM
ncbi:phosphonopyruvate decarboxylase [bacterium]|nr:phosphonopyruvate decarboxylase [bacterium]